MPFGRKRDNDATDEGVSASCTVTYKGGLRHLPKAKLGKITLDILKIDSAWRQGRTRRASSGPTFIRQSLSVLDAMVLGEPGVLEARSGSPCGCAQRGPHEGPEARRRGNRTEPRRWADNSSPTWWLAAHRLADQLSPEMGPRSARRGSAAPCTRSRCARRRRRRWRR